MNRFAALLDRLAYEPGRNNKLRLMTDYFRGAGDPERGWALAALTGSLRFAHAKPGMIRTLIAERTDPVLFELSYDYVGDLSETVALMWPRSPTHAPSAPLPPRGGGEGSGVAGGSTSSRSDVGTEPAEAPPTPNLESELRSARTPASGRGSALRPFPYHPSSTILPRDLPDSSKAWARLRLVALIVPKV